MRAATYDRLLRAYRDQGDLLALARLFDLTAPDLYRLAAHLVRDGSSADDLVQAAFLTTIENVKSWRGEGGARAYLCGILVNEARRWMRAQTRREVALSREPSATDADPLDRSAERELKSRLGSAVSGLPDPYREVLAMELETGAGPAAIARQLGRRPATVRSQMHRGLDLLRRVLPAGLAAWLFGVLCPVPAVAAIRPIILAQAASMTGAGAVTLSTSAGLLSGVLAVKKFALALGVCAAAVVLSAPWWTEHQGEPDLEVARETEGGPVAQSPRREVAGAPDSESSIRTRKSDHRPTMESGLQVSDDPAQLGWRIFATFKDSRPQENTSWQYRLADSQDLLYAESLGRRPALPDVFAIEDLKFGPFQTLPAKRTLELPGDTIDELSVLAFPDDREFGQLHLLVSQNQGDSPSQKIGWEEFEARWKKDKKEVPPISIRARCFSRQGLVWNPIPIEGAGAKLGLAANTVLEATWGDGARARFRPRKSRKFPGKPEFSQSAIRLVDLQTGHDVSSAEVFQFQSYAGDIGCRLTRDADGHWPLVTWGRGRRSSRDNIRVRALGYQSTRFVLDHHNAKSHRVQIVPLLPAMTQPCRLVDVGQQPVVKAKVTVRASQAGRVLLQGKTDEQGDVLFRAAYAWPRSWFEDKDHDPVIVVEGEDGSIGLLTGVPLAAIVRGVILRMLNPPRALVLRIVDAKDQPLSARILVDISSQNRDSKPVYNRAGAAYGYSDEEGLARLGRLHARHAHVRILAGGRLAHDERLEIFDDEREQLIRLPETVTIGGVVVDAQGAAVSRVQLSMRPTGESRTAGGVHSLARSDEEGRFRFEVPSSSEAYDIDIDRAGLSSQHPVRAVPSAFRGVTAGQDLRVVVHRVIQTSFRFEREDGAPVRGVRIAWLDNPTSKMLSMTPVWQKDFGGVWINDQSRVPLFEGELRLGFQAAGCERLERTVQIREGGSPLRIRLAPGPVIRGRIALREPVVPGQWSPPPHHYLLALESVEGFGDVQAEWRFVGGRHQSIQVDATGTFVVGPLTPGHYVIRRGAWNGEIIRRFELRQDIDLGQLEP